MKTLVTVFVLMFVASSFMTTTATAEAPHDSFIGIYFDEVGDENCAELPMGFYGAHIVLTDMISTEVWAWEAKLTFSNLYPNTLVHRGQAVDFGTRLDEHIVGFTTPLPVIGGTVVLADFDFLIPNEKMGYVVIGPIYFSLLENGLPAYIDGANDGFLLNPVELHPDPAQFDLISSFFVNSGTCKPVATDHQPFGSIKSLYR